MDTSCASLANSTKRLWHFLSSSWRWSESKLVFSSSESELAAFFLRPRFAGGFPVAVPLAPPRPPRPLVLPPCLFSPRRPRVEAVFFIVNSSWNKSLKLFFASWTNIFVVAIRRYGSFWGRSVCTARSWHSSEIRSAIANLKPWTWMKPSVEKRLFERKVRRYIISAKQVFF